MDLLNDLKAGGYKVVFMKPKFAVTTIPSYDEAIMKQVKGPVSDGRPTASVVRTISEQRLTRTWRRTSSNADAGRLSDFFAMGVTVNVCRSKWRGTAPF